MIPSTYDDLVWYMPDARAKLLDHKEKLGLAEYVGSGSTGIIFRKGSNVLKLPKNTIPREEDWPQLHPETLNQFRRDNQKNYDALEN